MTGNTPGCHGEHAKRYIRRVQVNKKEEAGIIYSQYNPTAVVPSIWSTNNTDNVIMFAIEAKEGSKYKKELLGVEQLKAVQILQKYWVDNGNTDPDKHLSHNVSVTVQVPENEWDNVTKYIWDNRQDFTGISLLPELGDAIYNQAAYSEVFTPEELLQKYGDGIMFASGLIVDTINVFGDLWKACDTVKGIGEKLYTTPEEAKEFYDKIDDEYNLPDNFEEMPYKEVISLVDRCSQKKAEFFMQLGYTKNFAYELAENNIKLPVSEIIKYMDDNMYGKVSKLAEKRDIVRRIKKFANKYFNGDLDKTLFALKHVQLYHDWCQITSTYKPVEWDKVTWKNNVNVNVDTLAAQSCAGGACEIIKI